MTPPNARPTAVATCEHCGWQVQHTDDTVLEVATFLRKKIMAHVNEVHPEKIGPQ